MPKLIFRGSDLGAVLDYFRATSDTFTVERTGYTATIRAKGKTFLFAESGVNPRLFGLLHKLKEQCSRVQVGQVTEDAVTFYDFGGVRRIVPPRRAWSVDLTGAYVQALLHLGLIDGELFSKLKALPKEDRLRVVGMLATSKSVVEYLDGEVVDAYTSISELRHVFLRCCEEVGHVLSDVRPLPGYLFFWVDGAFFDYPATDVLEHFAATGYPAKVEAIQDLRWSDSRKYLFYAKDGEKKYLCVPRGRKPAASWIAEHLSKPLTSACPF